MKTYDVVLVGSGISSLTAATILAKRGMSVCVLEQYKKPGGYLHSFKRFNHLFDTGAHYVGAMEPGEPFHTILSYLGSSIRSFLFRSILRGLMSLTFPKIEIAIPRDMKRSLAL